MEMEKTYEFDGNVDMAGLFGSFDHNLKLIEQNTHTHILNRGTDVRIVGEEENVEKAGKVFSNLLSLMERGETLNDQNILYVISMVNEGIDQGASLLADGTVCISAKGRAIKAKTLGQKKYLEAIKNNTITFGIGPAGTGKTYLAVASAVTSFRNKEVSRIILTRPAVEAGEKLGFLPGDLQSKVDPYLRPLYDAMYDMLGADGYARYSEKGMIEVAPLAYMRGRTLDDAYIILDEAQNTTPEQMKMFLTRIGFGSRAIITGDITQIDLPSDTKSGLKECMKILKNIDDIAFCSFTEKDVVRHPLVQKIIKAYERYDENLERKRNYK